VSPMRLGRVFKTPAPGTGSAPLVRVVPRSVCAPVVAVLTVVPRQLAVAAAGVGMVMPAPMRGPRGRRPRRRGIGLDPAGTLRIRGPCRSRGPGRGRTRDPGGRCTAQRDRHPATDGDPLRRGRIGGIRDGGVCARGHHRLHGDRFDHATGAAGEPAADEDSRQHRTDRREDAGNDPRTPEHSRSIPAVQPLNRGSVVGLL
jgi:hypothetical protein